MQKSSSTRREPGVIRLVLNLALTGPIVALAASAQQAPNPQSASPDSVQLKIESNLVVVRAVVRDAQGQPVKGLTKEDFKIFDRGKEQSIAQFEEQSASSLSPALAAAPGQPAAAPSTAATDRFIALYFDDLDTSEAEMMQARDAADRFLSANLHPRDHIAIFTTSKALSNFTSDSKQIHEALFQLHASPRMQSRMHECPDLSDYQAQEMVQDSDMHSNEWVVALAEVKICAPPPDPRDTPTAIRMVAERIAARSQGQTRDNLAMFAAVVKYIAGAPGSRTVVLVSPGFLSASEQLAIDRTIDRALRTQVVINSLDPQGLAVLMREGDASNSSIMLPDPHATAARHHLDQQKEFVGADVLAQVAEGTGGAFFHDNNDLNAGFDALAGHPIEYVLAFAPKDIKLDGKFHEIKVTLVEKQRGYSIRTRRGYFAVKQEEAAAAQPAPSPLEAKTAPDAAGRANAGSSSSTHETGKTSGPSDLTKAPSAPELDPQHLQDALRSTTDNADLPVGMEASPSEGEGATRLIALTVHLDTKTLPLRSENAYHVDAVTFAVALFDQNNQVIEVKQRQAKVDLTDDQLQDFLNDGLEVNMMFEVKPATYRLRVAVVEANQHKLTAFSRTVNVP